MSIMRSPPKSATDSGSKSQPDLSKISGEAIESQITFRKRKYMESSECECSGEIKLVRNELSRISSLLENYVETNTQIMNQMRNSIVEVKNEITELKTSHEQTRNFVNTNIKELTSDIQDIKSSTLEIASKHGQMKTQLSQLETKILHGENKLMSLESDFKELKLKPVSSFNNQLCLNEQIIREIQDRKKRENNIILLGIPEQTSYSVEQRVLKDESEVLYIISQISKDIPKPVKIFRIGKFIPGKMRGLKVCFDKPEPAMQLLRSKDKIASNIKIYSDQTPAQRDYFLKTKNELNNRISNGEKDITIKYIKGIPSVVKSTPKNSHQ